MAINIISRQITLDVYRQDKSPVTVNAIAADNDTRYVAAEIQNDGVRYDISSSATVELMVLRPDKVGVSIVGQPQELTYETDPVFDPDTGETAPGETVTYYGVYAELDQAALAKSGTLLGQFKITSGNQVLRTELFKVNNGRALDAETSDWSGEYQGYNLDELVQSVNSAVATVTEMETDVSELKSGIRDLQDGGYVADAQKIQEKIDNYLDEHPEATTTVQDDSLTTAKYKNHSVSKEKISKELFIPICIPNDYVTVNNLMDLSAAETYDLFDAYVTEGLLTKTRLGYGSANTSDAEAVEDTALPIYMYSFRNKMASAQNYTTSAYAKPILLTNSIHGNEKMGIPIMLTMLKAYKDGMNEQITSLFDDFGIDFVPVLNPYGYEQAIGTTMETVNENIGRHNARGVDLNRNGTTCWEVLTDERKGNAPLSECESKIIHNLAVVNGDNYSFYVDIHTERFRPEQNYFGTVTCGSTIVRSIFSTIMSKMDERMKTEYGYDMLTELNGLSIVGLVNRYPMHFIDRCYALDSYMTACLYEAPRYNGGEIYPIKSQKFTCDIFINFLITVVNYLKLYRPINNTIDRQYRRNKAFQKDILPATKDGWEYGVVTDRGEFDSYVRVRTADKIQVDSYAYYDIVPSYDNLYYNVVLSNANVTKYIDWNHGQSRIYTDAYTHIRVSLSIGDPNDASNGHVINMPELGHDYDIVVKKTDMADVDIAPDLPSSVATINYARMQKIGRVAFVVIRFTLTANVNKNTDILSGFPLDISGYTGLSNIRLFDFNTKTCYDGYITHDDGITVSSLRCLSDLVSGHSIRATFMYFTSN